MTPDDAEFAAFYRRHRAACLRAVIAATGDPPAAEDLVAEGFTRAWTSWRTVSRHPAPHAWVVRTALNAGVSSWRRRRREVPLEAPGRTPVATDRLAGATPDDAQDHLVDPVLLAALRRLPVRQREVVALRIVLDLDTDTTARVLGIAAGTVTAHLHRAMSTLRSQLLNTDSQEVPR